MGVFKSMEDVLDDIQQKFYENNPAALVAEKYRTYFYNFLQIALGDRPARMCPELDFVPGKDCYTDGNKITIGYDFVKAETEDEIMLEYLYVIGHEAQHVLSSPGKYWKWGQERALHVLLDAMCFHLYGEHLSETDHELFCKKVEKDGYAISISSLRQIVHFILNSVEDGRIESIRCRKSRLFKDEMYLYRSRVWKENPLDAQASNLTVLMNSILSLSTMGLYQKGFQEEHAGDELDNTLSELLPVLAEGVGARSCQECMTVCFSIFPVLVPYVLEYCKMSKKEQEETIEDTIQKSGQPTQPGTYNSPSNMEEKNDVKDEGAASSGTGGKGNKENDEKIMGLDGLKDSLGASFNREKEAEFGISDREIERQMKRERSEAIARAKAKTNEIKQTAGRQMPKIKECADTTPPVTSKTLKTRDQTGLRGDFEEKKRDYTLYLQMPQFLAQRAAAFARKIEKVFERENVPELDHRTSGNVDSGKLYKLLIGELDFYRSQEEEGELDTCVYVLVDNSGSMGHGAGSKRNYAWETMSVIEEGFKKYVPLKITAFDAHRYINHECVKNWEERYNANCSYNYLHQTQTGAGNYDGVSIRVATEELAARPEKNKVLFVLSDGLPAYGNGEQDTAAAAEEARRAGITLIPVYFGEEAVRDGEVNLNSANAKKFTKMYRKNVIITIPEKVEDEVVDKLTNIVMNNLMGKPQRDVVVIER